MKDQPIVITMSLDLANAGAIWITVNVGIYFWGLPNTITATYGADWTFDASTLVSVCSNFDAVPQANCIIQILKVQYVTPLDIYATPFSNQGNERRRLQMLNFF